MNIALLIKKGEYGEFLEANNQKKEFKFYGKIQHFPKNTKVGERCYVIVSNRIIGYHLIEEFKEFKENGPECMILGTYWGKGRYVVRSSKTWRPILRPIPYGLGMSVFKYVPF